MIKLNEEWASAYNDETDEIETITRRKTIEILFEAGDMRGCLAEILDYLSDLEKSNDDNI